MGRPRIHGELLKLGINVGQTSVANTWRGNVSVLDRYIGLRKWAAVYSMPNKFSGDCAYGGRAAQQLDARVSDSMTVVHALIEQLSSSDIGF